MTTENDDLPGVVFHKKSSQVLGINKKGVKRVEVILEAEVRDDEVWQAAEEKLNGLKVYTTDDFKGEMLNALREEFNKMEALYNQLQRDHKHVLEENQHMKAGLSVLNQSLEE